MSEDTEQMEDSARQEEEVQSEPVDHDLEMNGHAQDPNEEVEVVAVVAGSEDMSEDIEQIEDSTRLTRQEEVQSEPAGRDLEINRHAQAPEVEVVAVVAGSEDEDEEFPPPKFPMAKMRRIMAICLATTDEEHSVDNAKGGKGTGKFIITKEAVYLVTLATEYFVKTIASRAGDITTSSKKKTLSMDFLKRALSDVDAFAFLEGCFQPSIIIGD